MLVLTRKIGEKIVLPGLNVEITVMEVSKSRARLAISAPKEIRVTRSELLHRESVSPASSKAEPLVPAKPAVPAGI